MIESWVDIVGYEGLYEVSNLGRIRRNGKILKPSKVRHGYLQIALYKNGIYKRFYIHRLVAYAFIPNPNSYPEVNHRDEDKTNNTVDNLEWCTHEYNNNYGTRNERLSKPVLQFDLQGNFLREWPSTAKVEEETGMDHSNISKCCSGNRSSAGGFVWRFKE